MGTPLPREDESESPASPGEVASGFGSVLRNRAFLSLWTAQVLSQTAQNSLWYALIVLVGDITQQTTLSIGVTIVLVQLPTVLFSGVSGVLVDRISKRLILIGTNVIRVAGVVGYIAFQRHLAGLYLITFLVAVISQPFAPAEGSTIPAVVGEEGLITANSLFQMTFMASQAVGFALAPIAIGVFGIQTTLIVLAALFGAAALSLTALPPSSDRLTSGEGIHLRETAEHIWRDLSEVTEYVLRDPPLAVALFQISLAPTLLLVLAEVGPNFLKYTLGIGQTGTSLFFLLAPAGAGLAVGMLILGQWGYRLRKDKLVIISLVALGVTVIGLASVPVLSTFWQKLAVFGLHVPLGVQMTFTMVPISMLLGIEVAFINAPVQTIVQQRAAPEIRGRVLAMQQTLTAAMAIPPLLVVGSVAAVIGTPATLTLVGLVMIGVGLVTVYYS